jgi:hypothetical protein
VHHFNVGGYEGYLTVGFYEDGSPGCWGRCERAALLPV